MTNGVLTWLFPALLALFLYGIGQGLVKKYIADVPPARFCLYFVVAKALVNLGFFWSQPHPPPFSPEGRAVLLVGLLAYIMDGIGWILYFESIIAGPITIIGTLSAAYPALTVVFARIFLSELLTPVQYVGVVLVIGGCIGLSYSPFDPIAKSTDKRWIPLAASALVIWGISQTIVKYSYRLPQASEVNLALFNTLGGTLTLGLYGLLYGRKIHEEAKGRVKTLAASAKEWMQSFLPMGMMAGGDLGVIVASKSGPISVVTPLTGAYPVVTLGFATLILREKITPLQWICVFLILLGMVLSPGSG